VPLHLKSTDVSKQLEGAASVLIVSCPICPPISIAMQQNSPCLEFFKHGINTPAFEDHIDSIREPLKQHGVRTGTYRSFLPTPTMCLWTEGQRRRLRKRAQNYEAVIVLGCKTARYTVEEALEGMNCKVVQAMWTVGMTNAKLSFQFPMTITLEDKVRINKAGKVEKMAS